MSRVCSLHKPVHAYLYPWALDGGICLFCLQAKTPEQWYASDGAVPEVSNGVVPSPLAADSVCVECSRRVVWVATSSRSPS